MGKNNGGGGYPSFENLCVRVEDLEMKMGAILAAIRSNQEMFKVYREAMEEAESHRRQILDFEERNRRAVEEADRKARERGRFIP